MQVTVFMSLNQNSKNWNFNRSECIADTYQKIIFLQNKYSPKLNIKTNKNILLRLDHKYFFLRYSTVELINVEKKLLRAILTVE